MKKAFLDKYAFHLDILNDALKDVEKKIEVQRLLFDSYDANHAHEQQQVAKKIAELYIDKSHLEWGINFLKGEK